MSGITQTCWLIVIAYFLLDGIRHFHGGPVWRKPCLRRWSHLRGAAVFRPFTL